MSKCTGPEIGALLPAYELNTESEENIERFEMHLLQCEYCFERLRRFEQQASLLSSDDDVKKLVRETGGDARSQQQTLLRRLWRYVWPEAPLVFKPALAYLLILFMILPAYWGVRELTETRIVPVQTVNLFPDRSTGEGAFRIGVGNDGLISFVFRGAVAGKAYRVAIQSEDGQVVFEDHTFTSFDEYGTGRLLFPLAEMKPGTYRLMISDPGADAASATQEYSFTIEE